MRLYTTIDALKLKVITRFMPCAHASVRNIILIKETYVAYTYDRLRKLRGLSGCSYQRSRVLIS